MLAHFLAQLVGGHGATHQDHVADDGLTGDLVGRAHHGGLGHGRVVDQRGLDLGGGDPVTRHVHHVVHPAQQPQVAVAVHPGAVAREVAAREARPVGVVIALRVAPDAAQHRRPRTGERQVAAAGFHHAAGVVHHLSEHPGQRVGGRTGLGDSDARQRRDHVAAGLGLPPGIGDRAAAGADVAVIPHPRFGVDRLAHRAQHPQAGQVVAGRPLLAPFHERADGRRRSV